MAFYVLFKNKNTLTFIYIFCFLFNLQMCQIILTDPVYHKKNQLQVKELRKPSDFKSRQKLSGTLGLEIRYQTRPFTDCLYSAKAWEFAVNTFRTM